MVVTVPRKLEAGASAAAAAFVYHPPPRWQGHFQGLTGSVGTARDGTLNLLFLQDLLEGHRGL
jgi:hypothetical protein